MPFSYAQYTGNGSTTTFSVPFPYLLKAHVKLYTGYNVLDGTFATQLVDGVGYTWTSDTQVQTTAAPAVGVVLTVVRQTPSNALAVQWQDGSNLVANDLIDSSLQNLYVVQEQQDVIGLSAASSNTANANAATALSTANAASTTANAIAGTANTALSNSSAAVATANAASTTANGIAGTANTALSNSSAANTTANAANTTANAANATANGIAGTANTALANANAAVATANAANATANGIAGTANTALSNSTAAQSTASAAVTTANAASATATAASSFTQAGTGAVARTVDSKLKDVVSVKDFGAVGDGVADDTAAIQNAVNEAMKTGKQVLIEGPGPYLISSTIQVKVTRDLAPTDVTPSSDVHFSDNTSAYILGLGTPTLKATASMTAMMELIYDTTDSDIGPFYSKVEGIGFDGNSLATSGIKSNYSMHVTIERNRFWNLARGIEYIGYGVVKIEANTFKCFYGIYFVGGGGDTLIVANDFYPQESVNNSACIYLGYYSGNLRIFSNVFTDEYAAGFITYGIQIAGDTAAGNEEIRDLTISANEFCGLFAAIRAVGKSSTAKNIYRVKIEGNHTLPYGPTKNTGRLLSAVNCVELLVSNNFCNSTSLIDATAIGVETVGCKQTTLHGNKFSNFSGAAFSMTDCTDSEITSNTFIDCGKLGTSYTVVPIFGSLSARNYFRLNYFRQSSTSYGDYGILESTGVDYTFSFSNVFDGFNLPHVKVGANSVMRREEYASTIPTDGSYYTGDVVWNTAPSAGAAPGWVCTTSGVTTFVFKAMANLAP